jgi:DNA polymerase elongation subunit (family B)
LNTRRTNFPECPGYEGRLLLDVYHYIREHYPGRTGQGAYKLNAISEHFLGDQKENVHYTQIPVLHRGNAETRRELAVYCLKVSKHPDLICSSFTFYIGLGFLSSAALTKKVEVLRDGSEASQRSLRAL